MEHEHYLFGVVKLLGNVVLFRRFTAAMAECRPGELVQEWFAEAGKDRLVLVREWSHGFDGEITCTVRRPDRVPGWSGVH